MVFFRDEGISKKVTWQIKIFKITKMYKLINNKFKYLGHWNMFLSNTAKSSGSTKK